MDASFDELFTFVGDGGRQDIMRDKESVETSGTVPRVMPEGNLKWEKGEGMSVGIDYRVTLSSKKGLRVGGRVNYFRCLVGIDNTVTLSSKKGLRVGGRVKKRIIHLLPRVGWLLLAGVPGSLLVALHQRF